MSLKKNAVYLDNSQVSRPSDEVFSKINNFYQNHWTIPSQPHKLGQATLDPLKQAIEAIYQLLGVKVQDTILFTSSSAEAVNQVFLSSYQTITLKEGKNHFLTTSIEEAPALMNLERLEELDCATTTIKPNLYGIITPQAVIEALTPRSALLVISWGNGLTGIIQPIAEIAEICKLRGVQLLVEASHIIGKRSLQLEEFKPDYLCFDGAQIHAPLGTGALYIRQGINFKPLIYGGGKERAGPLNTYGLIGLGVACKQAYDAIDYMSTEVARLKYYFEKELVKRIPLAKIIFEKQERLSHITAIAFQGIVNEALLYLLNNQEIYASIGGGAMQQIGYLLQACGLDLKLAHATISFSLSRYTKEEEIEQTLLVLENLVPKLQNMLPLED